ncbi:MAG: YdbH domain-containing protein, partial [Gammaproteobacteria bacterium]
EINIPEMTIEYDAASLLYGKASIIKIPSMTLQVTQPLTQFALNSKETGQPNLLKIAALTQLLPTKQLQVSNLIIQSQKNAAESINNIFKMQVDLHPRLIHKNHYKLKILLDGANPLILIKTASINGNHLQAKIKGNLILSKSILFNGNFSFAADDITLPKNHLIFKHDQANGALSLDKLGLHLNGKYNVKKFYFVNIAFDKNPLALHGKLDITSNKLHVDLIGHDKDDYMQGHAFIDDNTLNINATSVNFVAHNINLQSIFTQLTQPIIFSRGVININGNIGLADQIPSSLHIIGTNLDGNIAAKTLFTDMNTELVVTKFNPFTTAPAQQLSIATFDPGLPFNNVTLTYQIVPDEQHKIQFKVDASHAQFAGGTVSSNDFTYDPNAANHSVWVQAHNISVGTILHYTKVQGLSGTGTLNGSLLFQWGEDGLQIKEGKLAGAGTDNKITYQPTGITKSMTSKSAQLALVMNALKNFHYKNFTVNIGTRGNEMMLVAHLIGFNPDLYDGLPIALNFTLTGELNLILDTILYLYKVS